jgi:hypothetical protein
MSKTLAMIPKRNLRRVGPKRQARVPLEDQVVFVGRAIMPSSLHNTMVFCGNYDETTGAGHVDWAIRGNDLTDPYVAVGGEEVAGFDELAALYDQFCVLGAKFTITVANYDTSNPVRVTTVPLLVTTDLSNGAAPSQAKARSILVQNPKPGTIVTEMTTREMLGYGPRDPIDKDYWGVGGCAQPALMWYMHFVFDGKVGTALATHYNLKVEYDTLWTGRKIFSQV